jgi:hypothetical protein
LRHVTHSENGCRGAYKHEFLPPEPFLHFSQRTCPIHYFRSKTHVWGGFTQFHCRTSLIPKIGVGVHTSKSFCHRNHFFVFRNQHAQSTTLGPKLMFGVVSRNFIAARHSFRKRVSGCIQARVFATGTISSFFRNQHAQSTTLGPKLMFGVVSRNFDDARHSFRKWVSECIQSTSFCHRNHIFVFPNEHAQSTTLSPKRMFGVVSRDFIAARHPFRKRVSGCIQARVFATGTISSFFAKTCPIHYFRSKTHIWGGFAQFHCGTSLIPKTGVEVHTSTSFCHRNHFFIFRNEHAQSTTLGPKLMFGVVSRNFIAARHPFRKRVSGCIQARGFATGTISSFFATNMPNPLL